MQGLAVGRIVHWVNQEGVVLAAIVAAVNDATTGECLLGVFDPNLNTVPYWTALYNEAGEPTTWHWPSKV